MPACAFWKKESTFGELSQLLTTDVFMSHTTEASRQAQILWRRAFHNFAFPYNVFAKDMADVKKKKKKQGQGRFWLNEQKLNFPPSSHKKKKSNRRQEVPFEDWGHRVVLNNNRTVRSTVWVYNTVLQHPQNLLPTHQFLTLVRILFSDNLCNIFPVSCINRVKNGGVNKFNCAMHKYPF